MRTRGALDRPCADATNACANATRPAYARWLGLRPVQRRNAWQNADGLA